jgi:DNA-binding NtrC family response regulator
MTTPEGSAISVLIADDDALVRRVLRMAFESQGFDVREASDAASTVAEAATRPHLVVLDINMPGGTLRETLGELRARHPGLPTLVLSGNHSPPADLPTEHTEFARKPIDLHDLLSTVRRLLEQSGESGP